MSGSPQPWPQDPFQLLPQRYLLVQGPWLLLALDKVVPNAPGQFGHPWRVLAVTPPTRATVRVATGLTPGETRIKVQIESLIFHFRSLFPMLLVILRVFPLNCHTYVLFVTKCDTKFYDTVTLI